MKQIVLSIILAILVSLFFFPFNTVWLPTVNTKMALAAFAPILLIINGARLGNSQFNHNLLALSLCGLFVSFVGFIAVVYNNTHDYTYASYFISMWVWLGGAYVVIKAIQFAFGSASFQIVGNLLIIVSVIQCILAQIISHSTLVADFVDSFMVSTGFMGKAEERLYGIGCALDAAGMKFAAVLTIIAFLCQYQNPGYKRWLYILSFFIISVFGSMISRTAIIGVFLSILLWVILYLYNSERRQEIRSSLVSVLVFTLLLLPVIIYFYNTDVNFHSNIRFAFEGFFSLAEKGKWIVRSNQMMESMIVWPDNFKTWIIGDGYFENPTNDFYYTGPAYNYYMGVDTGYCRFLFYFGVIGLMAFSSVFIAATIICSKEMPKYAPVFWIILLLNFICWVKVSSDIFPVYALFLWLSADAANRELSKQKQD